MVVDLQRHIREGLESSCIFRGVFFISECCFFGFLVSMTTKITVQRGRCGLHSMRKREIVCFRSVQNRFFFYHVVGTILATKRETLSFSDKDVDEVLKKKQMEQRRITCCHVA